MAVENPKAQVESQRTTYLERLRDEAAVVHTPDFITLSRMYLSKVPLCGAAAFRLKDGTEGILINYDYFQRTLGADYTDLIPYEIEHEAQELWFLRGQQETDPFGPAHYRAIRETMKKAKKDGKLDDFLDLKETQMAWFKELGDPHTDQELEYYYQVDNQLRGFPIEQSHGRLKARLFGAGWIGMGATFAFTLGVDPVIQILQRESSIGEKAFILAISAVGILGGSSIVAEGAHDLATARHHSLSYPLLNRIKEKWESKNT